MCVMTCVEVRGQLEGKVQVIRVGGQCSNPLNHLVSPWLFLDGKPFEASTLQGSGWWLVIKPRCFATESIINTYVSIGIHLQTQASFVEGLSSEPLERVTCEVLDGISLWL